MSTNVNEFATRLAEIGVINNGTAKAMMDVMAKPYRDPQFPGLTDQLIGQVEGWHNLANGLDYTSDRNFAIIVDKGVKHIIKFAKANVSAENIRTKNYTSVGKKLAALDDKIHKIETDIRLNPEGVQRMNIRETSSNMLNTYIAALGKIRSSVTDPSQLERIDSSMAKLKEISTIVSSAADVTSKLAAKTQTGVFEPIITWANDFATGNFNSDGVKLLDKSIVAAKTWARLPLNLKAKPATEDDYIHEDKIHDSIRRHAATDNAVEKIENAINLIERAYTNLNSMTDSTDAERQKAENAAEIEKLQIRQNELNYMAQTGQMDVDDALDECDILNETIEELREANRDLSDDIADNLLIRTGRKTTLDDISKTFKKLLQYKSTPEIMELVEKHINFEALNSFLTSTNNTALDELMDIKQIDKAIMDNIRKGTEEHKNILDQQRQERRQEREERRQQRAERRGNTQAQTQESREEKLRRLAAMSGGAAAAPDNTIHPNTQYENNQESSFKLSLSDLDN